MENVKDSRTVREIKLACLSYLLVWEESMTTHKFPRERERENRWTTQADVSMNQQRL